MYKKTYTAGTELAGEGRGTYLATNIALQSIIQQRQK